MSSTGRARRGKNEEGYLWVSCCYCPASRQSLVWSCGTDARIHWRKYWSWSSRLVRPSREVGLLRAMGPSRVGASALLGRTSSFWAMVPVLPLPSSTRNHPAAASSVRAAGAAGIRVLVLLPESSGLLPLRQRMPWRMDEGGTTSDSTEPVKEGLPKCVGDEFLCCFWP